MAAPDRAEFDAACGQLRDSHKRSEQLADRYRQPGLSDFERMVIKDEMIKQLQGSYRLFGKIVVIFCMNDPDTREDDIEFFTRFLDVEPAILAKNHLSAAQRRHGVGELAQK
jgi:hypothetical protein